MVGKFWVSDYRIRSCKSISILLATFLRELKPRTKVERLRKILSVIPLCFKAGLISVIFFLWAGNCLSKPVILISGGGPAGLLSAWLMNELVIDVDIVVVEKRDRPIRDNVVGLDRFAAMVLSSLGFEPGFYRIPAATYSPDLVNQFDFADPPIHEGWIGFARLSRLEDFLRAKIKEAGIRFLPQTNMVNVQTKPNSIEQLNVTLSNGEILDVRHLVIAEGANPSSLLDIKLLKEFTTTRDTGIVAPYQYIIVYFDKPFSSYKRAFFPITRRTDPETTPMRILLDEYQGRRWAYGFFPVLETFSDDEIRQRIADMFAKNPEYATVVDTSSFKIDKRFSVHLIESTVNDTVANRLISIIADARMSSSILTGRGLITAIIDAVGLTKVLAAMQEGDPIADTYLRQFAEMQAELRKALKDTTRRNISSEMQAIRKIWPDKVCEFRVKSRAKEDGTVMPGIKIRLK